MATVRSWSTATKVAWALRVGMLWCFVGHGAFGITGKEGWLPYYRVFGVSDDVAWKTMAIVGTMDIAIGVISFLRPMRAVLAWAAFWTIFTAVLRPLADQGLWQEVAERGGNFGLPIALLLLVGRGDGTLRSWFEHARPSELSDRAADNLAWVMRGAIALLLIGHGGFGVTHLHDGQWTSYFGALGIGPETVSAANLIVLVGLFEIALGLVVLVVPASLRGYFLGVLVWKVATELLRPLAGENFFEFVERGGDWFLPLALYLFLAPTAGQGRSVEARAGARPAAAAPHTVAYEGVHTGASNGATRNGDTAAQAAFRAHLLRQLVVGAPTTDVPARDTAQDDGPQWPGGHVR